MHSKGREDLSGTGNRLVLTIGHSTRTLEEFIALLKLNSATEVTDIRTIPRSRHNPQFNSDVLPLELGESGIAYVHMAGLGGLRHARPDSPNRGWRNASFRGFADYMQTDQFSAGVDKLIELFQTDTPALMCAEAVPWRCHRSLIADALIVRGIRVEHILGPGKRRKHTLTPWAVVRGMTITYPAPASPAEDNA
jgi:uncharacterized protein (DUF488 family)